MFSFEVYFLCLSSAYTIGDDRDFLIFSKNYLHIWQMARESYIFKVARAPIHNNERLTNT